MGALGIGSRVMTSTDTREITLAEDSSQGRLKLKTASCQPTSGEESSLEQGSLDILDSASDDIFDAPTGRGNVL